MAWRSSLHKPLLSQINNNTKTIHFGTSFLRSGSLSPIRAHSSLAPVQTTRNNPARQRMTACCNAGRSNSTTHSTRRTSNHRAIPDQHRMSGGLRIINSLHSWAPEPMGSRDGSDSHLLFRSVHLPISFFAPPLLP